MLSPDRFGGTRAGRTRRRTVAAVSEPSVTAESLIAALKEQGVLTEAELVSLLGARRDGVELNTLEMALVGRNVISNARLLLLKGAVAGRVVLDHPDPAISRRLDARVAFTTGALVLDREPLTVAMVEDLPQNVETVGRALGTREFEVYLVTAPQFADLLRSTYEGAERDTRPSCDGLFRVLADGVHQGCSDVHLCVGQPPVLRVDGR